MPGTYLEGYLPVLIHAVIVVGIAAAMVVLSSLIGRHVRSRAKLVPYESGIMPVGDTRQPLAVKFYLVAMLFILFDVEAVFLYPWAVVFRELKMFGFIEMLLYMAIIFSGFVYIWKKGVLDWNRPEPGEE
jgi:NADH-quinone oxidoreductase subunit A